MYALSLVAVEGAGRKAILAHTGSIQQLLQQLSSSDAAAVRYAALALGNLAMDADGRRAILLVSVGRREEGGGGSGAAAAGADLRLMPPPCRCRKCPAI